MYFTFSSLKHITVSSWTLLQTCNFAIIIPLTTIFLKARYKWTHIFAAVISITGLVLLILSNVNGTSFIDEEKPVGDIFIGFLMAWIGFASFAIVNVTTEILVKGKADRCEIMGMFGVSTGVLSLVLSFSCGELSFPMFSKNRLLLYSFASISSIYAFYMTTPIVLKRSGAALLQLSLLSSNIWSLLADIFIVREFNYNLVGFCIAFGMIVLGMLSFVLSGDPYVVNNVDEESTERLLQEDAFEI